MQKVPYQVIEIAQKLKDGHPSRRFRVRAVLKWFGAKRRGDSIIHEIERILGQYDLVTVPALIVPGIDDFVRFTLNSAPSGTGPCAVADAEDQKPSSLETEQAAAEPVLTAQDTATENGQDHLSDDQLEPENGEEVVAVRPDDHPVLTQSSDWTISSLTEKLNKGQLDLQPKFQREYVWRLKPELPSRLIESILLKIPIPPIYLGKMPGGRLEVIDGQQRLTTLLDFVSNKFALQRLHRMGSLNGKHFKELSIEQQDKILDEPIRTTVIDAAGNTELRYEIFERLNRGSMALNEQELRNCVYRGPFNDLLAELEWDPYWRKVKGGAEPEPRFKEREVILRFFAFANRLPQYTGNLKGFLNEYMAQYAPRDEAALKAHGALFRQTMQNIYTVFGNHSARLYEVNAKSRNGGWDTKFSVAALDMQASALMNRQPLKVQQAAEQIREMFLFTLLTDREVQDAISRRTGSTVQTKIRFQKFKAVVDPIIDGVLIEPRFFSYQFRDGLWQQAHVCKLCGNEIHSFEDCTVDHVIPYSKGGKTVAENGQLAHRSCNASKNDQVALAGPASV